MAKRPKNSFPLYAQQRFCVFQFYEPTRFSCDERICIFLFEVLFRLTQWSSTWAKKIPGGRFHALRDDFVIYEIWGAVSVSRGAISAG